MEKTIKGKLKARRIVSNEDTYDIQTDNHNFFANDVLVHNSEIILRPYQFCNLTEVVIRPDDTEKTLKKKVKIATILGTFQSTLTYFPYLRKIWQKNTEEERLLGVSLTGIYDNSLTNNPNNPELPKLLEALREVAVEANKEWSEKLGINQSVAITCVKPSGCFDPDQKVKTTDGIKSFREIFALQDINLNEKENDYRQWYELKTPIYVYDENNQIQLVTKLFVNGIEETYEIEMDDGNIFTCTPNHKFKLITGEWKEAKYLEEGDDIMQL